jgi:hypothetical protein
VKYEWEDNILEVLRLFGDEWASDDVRIVGYAAYNRETGEGALLFTNPEFADGVIRADVLKDIAGDANGEYDDSMKFENFYPKVAAQNQNK